jgi:hypothetical protein
MHTAYRTLAFLLILIPITLMPGRRHLPLDPDEPIAADGSLTAGRARTIFDFEPLLGAFGEMQPKADPDDPKVFAKAIEIEKYWGDESRKRIVDMFDLIDRSYCEGANRSQLIGTVRMYYFVRGRQKLSFSARGPQARIAIEREWSTPIDERIDEFVQQLVASGFLHLRDLPAQSFPEFTKVVAQTTVIGTACPR